MRVAEGVLYRSLIEKCVLLGECDLLEKVIGDLKEEFCNGDRRCVIRQNSK